MNVQEKYIKHVVSLYVIIIDSPQTNLSWLCIVGSQDTSLPIMTVEFIKRVQQLNLISVSVILESISPPISGKNSM